MTTSVFSILEDINKVIIPSFGILGIISSSIAAIGALIQIRLKNKEQIEAIKNANIDSEIKLIKTFSELMEIAHAYGDVEVSEEVVKKSLEKIDDLRDEEKRKVFNCIIKDSAFLIKPKGAAAQESAIAAVYCLGMKYGILYEPALAGLESLGKFKESGKKYFDLLKNKQG